MKTSVRPQDNEKSTPSIETRVIHEGGDEWHQRLRKNTGLFTKRVNFDSFARNAENSRFHSKGLIFVVSDLFGLRGQLTFSGGEHAS
jgi:hypothetical protein